MKLFLFLFLSSTVCFAQQPDPKEINLVAGNLAAQRNDAQNSVAVLQAKLALAEEKIKELEAKVKQWEDLKDKKDNEKEKAK